MALASALKGARHTPQTVTWQDEDGTALDISGTGATLTGKMIAERGGTSRAIDGTLALVDSGSGGVFTWTYGANDVGTVGVFWVQFTCTYTVGTFNRTQKAKFEVLPEIA